MSNRSWNKKNAHIEQSFEFTTHLMALNFVKEITTLAESANHHPDILFSFQKVSVQLTTHDKGKVTEKDWELAEKIDRLYETNSK